MSIVQILLIIFIVFAVSRVILRMRGGNLNPLGFVFWMSIWITALIGILFPALSTPLAKFLGIGRGVDVVIYLSIIILFYLVFRIYIIIEDVRQEITKLTTALAIENQSIYARLDKSKKPKANLSSSSSRKTTSHK